MRGASLSISRGNAVTTHFRPLNVQLHAPILSVHPARFNLAHHACADMASLPTLRYNNECTVYLTRNAVGRLKGSHANP